MLFNPVQDSKYGHIKDWKYLQCVGLVSIDKNLIPRQLMQEFIGTVRRTISA
jgi:hypothetical protein